MTKETTWYQGNDKISVDCRREPFNIAILLSTDHSLNYKRFIKHLTEQTPVESTSLEGSLATIVLDQNRRFSITKQDEGIELKILYTGNSEDRIEVAKILFEAYENIKAALPSKFDRKRFEKKIKDDFKLYQPEIKTNEAVVLEDKTYIEKLELEIQQQIQILSQGLGKPVGYVLTKYQIGCVIDEFNELYHVLLHHTTDLKKAQKYIKIMRKGIDLLEEYGPEEEKIDFINQARTKLEELVEHIYFKLGEGLNEPFIDQEKPRLKAVVIPEEELLEDQKRLRKIASLEGELAIAIKAEDFERAAIIRDEIEKLGSKHQA